MSMLYSCRGGACAGSTPARIGIKATWPFSRITVFTNGDIEIRLAIRSYLLQKESIIELVEAPYWFSGGVRIIHSNHNFHPYIKFWCYSFAALDKALNAAGHNISPWRETEYDEYQPKYDRSKKRKT
jgi:hypothetical protein